MDKDRIKGSAEHARFCSGKDRAFWLFLGNGLWAFGFLSGFSGEFAREIFPEFFAVSESPPPGPPASPQLPPLATRATGRILAIAATMLVAAMV